MEILGKMEPSLQLTASITAADCLQGCVKKNFQCQGNLYQKAIWGTILNYKPKYLKCYAGHEGQLFQEQFISLGYHTTVRPEFSF